MLRAAALALLLLALVPAAARAHHLTPAVTLESSLGRADREHVTKNELRWNATCGDPAAEIAVGVSRVMAVKGRGAVPLRVQWLERPRQGAGSFTMPMLPGQRWKPRVDVRCRHAGEGDEVAAFAETPDWQYLPPKLLGWGHAEGEICGFGPGDRRERLQARMWAAFDITALYDEGTILRKADKGIVLVVRGGGLRTRLRPTGPAAGSMLDPKQTLRFEAVFRRPGRVRMWIEFDGDRSNTLTVPVARLPRGCEEFASR